jgi:hypothetical protein
MSILAVCPVCRSQFKAPDHVAGRQTRCPRCGASMDLPALHPPTMTPAIEPQAPPVPDEAIAATGVATRPGPSAPDLPPEHEADSGGPRVWLLGLAAASGVLLVIVLGSVLAARLLPAPTDVETALEIVETPVEPEVNEAPPEPAAPPSKSRAERLAEVDAQEKEALAPLQRQIDNHKQTLRRLRKEEDALFAGKLKPAAAVKRSARVGAHLNDVAASMPALQRDLVVLLRKHQEFAQARRKVQHDHPEPGDVKLEDYAGLYLTPDEIGDLGKLALAAGSPKSTAGRHLQSAQSAGTVMRPIASGVFHDPDDQDLAVVVYDVTAYRGQAQEMRVHVYVHRLRGAWAVVELPERPNSVLPGAAPPHYLKEK